LSAKINYTIIIFEKLPDEYRKVDAFNGGVILTSKNTTTSYHKDIMWHIDKPNEFKITSAQYSQSFLITYDIQRITEYSNQTITSDLKFENYNNPSILTDPSFQVIWGNSTSFLLIYLGLLILGPVVYYISRKYSKFE